MVLIDGANSNKPWDQWDRLLLEAYQILDDERCPKCGYPVYLCHSTDNDLDFILEDDACGVSAEVERKNAEIQKKNKGGQEGVSYRPIPHSISGRPLVSFREPYYKQERIRREAMEKSRAPKGTKAPTAT